MQKKDIKVKVVESVQEDVNKGVVRMDTDYLRMIDCRPGDVIEIEGSRKTVAIADRSYPGDIGLEIIRMDGIIRKNAGAGIGDQVIVRRAEIKESKKLILAPAKKGVIVKASSDVFKQVLIGRPVTKGDIVALTSGNVRRRRSSDDLFNVLPDNMIGFGLSDIKFMVVDVYPKGSVIVTEETEIILNPEAVEVSEERLPEVSYEDVGGLEEEIKKIREMVELPLKHPEIFEKLGIDAPKGVLLHGPPGTGKTLLAKAVANETNSHFILINGPEIMGKFYGESESNLRKKFEEAEKNAPSIVFIDEIDAIASKREEAKGEVEKRVVAQLLAMMDGLKSRGRVVVIAATNIPNSLDPALRRPGRFDREVEVGVPSKAGRLNILKIHTRNMPLMTNAESLNKNYNEEHIQDLLKTIFSSYASKEIISNIPKEARDMKDLREIFILKTKDSFDKKLNSIKRDSAKEFVKLCENYIAEKIFNAIAAKIEIIDKKVNFSDDLDKHVETKLNDFKNIEYLKNLISESVKNMVLVDMASITHGFVGADLSALTKEAAMIVLRRVLPELNLDHDSEIKPEVLEKLQITRDDFKDALKVVRPSALREVLIQNPNVKWTQIGGLDTVKQELKETIEWPLKYPNAFKRLGVNPPKGVLLYGSPGTGKTLLAKAIATESEANFISVKGPELLSMWVGESEKGVRKIFEKARQAAPTIIFFDEVDALAPSRGFSADSHVTERVVNQLLTEIDGLNALHDVVIIGATNRPDILDTALLRPGRFDRIILVESPDEEARELIFKVHTKSMPLSKDINLKDLAKKTEGYVGADIESVVREAAIMALRKDINSEEVNLLDFEAALNKVRPSVTKEIREMYRNLSDHFAKAKAKEMKDSMPSYFG